MSDFEFLLNKYVEIRKGLRSASDMTEPERRELWVFVDNYVAGLERRLFKRAKNESRYNAKSVDAHNSRVMAFYDFLDFCIEHDKGVRWALQVFRMRFVDLEGLLTIARTGVVSVQEQIRAGISNPFTRRATRIAAAYRQCSKSLRRAATSFEEVAPCLKIGKATKKQRALWRSYFNYLQQLHNIAAPRPLVLNEETTRNDSELY